VICGIHDADPAFIRPLGTSFVMCRCTPRATAVIMRGRSRPRTVMSFSHQTVLARLGLWCALGLPFALIVGASRPEALSPAGALASGVLLSLSYAVPVHIAYWILDRPRPAWLRAALLVPSMMLCGIVLHRAHAAVDLAGPIWNSAINLAVILILALACRAAWRGHRARSDLIQAHRMREEAEDRALSAQLAPHTLYNLLNVLYDAALSTPERAPGLILSLAEMMRYLLEGCDRDDAPAHEEWAFVRAYRDFALERSAPGSRVELHFEGDPDASLPPLLVASLFENAVKHGAEPDGRLSIEATLRVRQGGFRFEMRNGANRTSSDRAPGSGRGLEIVRTRLQALYPGRHSFTVEPIEQGGYITLLEASEPQ
jgi:Histidine kinase